MGGKEENAPSADRPAKANLTAKALFMNYRFEQGIAD